MPSDERMNINERRKYLKLVRSRYVKSGRKERSRLQPLPASHAPGGQGDSRRHQSGNIPV